LVVPIFLECPNLLYSFLSLCRFLAREKVADRPNRVNVFGLAEWVRLPAVSLH
jgi:hypothetical protein